MYFLISVNLFEDVMKKAGINQPSLISLSTKNRYQRKRDVMRTHGFRKFFITQCDKANLNFTVREYLSGHKLPNMDASYIRTTEEDRLAEYIKAIDFLTVNPTKRLQEKVQELESEQAQEIAMLKERLKSYDKTLAIHEVYYEKSEKTFAEASKLIQQLGRAYMGLDDPKRLKHIEKHKEKLKDLLPALCCLRSLKR